MFSKRLDPQVLLEQHLERQALDLCRPTSFLGVVRMYGIAPHFPIQSPRGASITLHASNLFQARSAWLATQELARGCTSLAGQGAPLIASFCEWLTTAYSSRYQWLTTEAQRAWVAQVGLLVVVRHMMEEKYTRFLATGEPTFVDPWTGYVMGHLRAYHCIPTGAAHVLKSLLKEPQQRASLLADFLAELDIQIARHPFVCPEPLPPLPAGVCVPFHLPLPLSRRHEQVSSQQGGH